MNWKKALLVVLTLGLLCSHDRATAQHVLNQCIDFTPTTCPEAVKDRYLLQVEEFNLQHGLTGDAALSPMEVMWEALRLQSKALSLHKKRTELNALMNAQLQAVSDDIDADMPTAIPRCGDNEVNRENEDCDGTDDSACPGLCAPDCQCPPPPTTTTTTTMGTTTTTVP